VCEKPSLLSRSAVSPMPLSRTVLTALCTHCFHCILFSLHSAIHFTLHSAAFSAFCTHNMLHSLHPALSLRRLSAPISQTKWVMASFRHASQRVPHVRVQRKNMGARRAAALHFAYVPNPVFNTNPKTVFLNTTTPPDHTNLLAHMSPCLCQVVRVPGCCCQAEDSCLTSPCCCSLRGYIRLMSQLCS
jgi:hypothetical protein